MTETNMATPTAQVIGDPIAQSKSPQIHRFWLERLGMEGNYEACRVAADGLQDYLDRMRKEPHWAGCNVTMPHKQAIIEHLDHLDPTARKLGAVNTVVNREGNALQGFNTDATGFLEPLVPALKSAHLFRMARILGTGGAARAIIAALADNGFTLVVAGRNPAKARDLIDELAPDGEHHAVALSHFSEPTDFDFDQREGCLDLVINATPLGMDGHPPLAFDWSHAPPGAVAYDIVTSPVETPFTIAARRAGHPVITGLSMLIGQAAASFELFFGVEPPREHDGALIALLTQP